MQSVTTWRNESAPKLATTVIGDYSVDGNRRFHHDRRNLGSITLGWEEGSSKAVRYDLNLAGNKAVRRDMDAYFRERLKNMQEWLLHNRSTLSPPPDFVSARKTLRRVMLAAYEAEDSVVYATKFLGTIYVCVNFTDNEIRQRVPHTEQERRMTGWGYKFEQFMCDESDPNTGMDENESYSCVLRAQLGGHSLVYKCEVDGVDSKKNKGNRLPAANDLLELKTHNIKFSRFGLNKYKLRDAWAQCTLAGIPRLVVGYRDDGGIVHELKVLKVDDFQRLANGFFRPDEMTSYLNAFLRWVKSTVTVDDPNVVYELKINSRNFRSRRLDTAMAPEVVSPRFVQQMTYC